MTMPPRFDDLTSDRQQRLFACACCRSIWHLLLDEHSRHAVEVAERHADGVASDEELRAARASALEVLVGSDKAQRPVTSPSDRPPLIDPNALALHGGQADNPAAGAAHAAAGMVGDTTHLAVAAVSDWFAVPEAEEAELAKQSYFLGDIVRPSAPAFTFLPDWRTDTALSLARQMYESRDFSAMPILADALQDAGCDNEDVLSHCRGPGPHVRGCWVCDLVLGKE
jgi:hypothetical protein